MFNEWCEEVIAAKEITIRKLQLQLGVKDKKMAQLEKDARLCLDRALRAEANIGDVRKSLNKMSAERSRFIRKLKRAGVKV